MNDDICQIKLELDVFEIAAPNSKGNLKVLFLPFNNDLQTIYHSHSF